jgi:hypothetical protein
LSGGLLPAQAGAMLFGGTYIGMVSCPDHGRPLLPDATGEGWAR